MVLGLSGLGDGLVNSLGHSDALGRRGRTLVGHLGALLVMDHLLELVNISRALGSGSDDGLGSGNRLSNRLSNRGDCDGSKREENGAELHFGKEIGGLVVDGEMGVVILDVYTMDSSPC